MKSETRHILRIVQPCPLPLRHRKHTGQSLLQEKNRIGILSKTAEDSNLPNLQQALTAHKSKQHTSVPLTILGKLLLARLLSGQCEYVSAFLCNLSLSPKGLGELWLKEYLSKRSVVKRSNGHRGIQSSSIGSQPKD